MPPTASAAQKPAAMKARPIAARANPTHAATGPRPAVPQAAAKAPALPAFARPGLGMPSAAIAKASPPGHGFPGDRHYERSAKQPKDPHPSHANPKPSLLPKAPMPKPAVLATANSHAEPGRRTAVRHTAGGHTAGEHTLPPSVPAQPIPTPVRPMPLKAGIPGNTAAKVPAHFASHGEAHPTAVKPSLHTAKAEAASSTRSKALHSAATNMLAAKPRPRLAQMSPPKSAGQGSGQPLAPHIKEAIQHSLMVDLSAVRLHASTAAQRKAQSLAARAFTFGNDIFLGHGEHPTDLTLISHEAAHVIQQQGAPTMQAWSDDRSDRYEREADNAAAAVQRGESFAVRERVESPRVQRLGISDALDYFADKANNIPGFRMFTIVLGVNPINMEHVDRNAANVLRAVVEFIPGGGLITQALDKYGVFDKVGAWVSDQLDTLAMTGGSIKKAILDFLDSLSWTDIFHLGDVWDRAKRIFTEPIERIKSFVKGFLEGIWKFVRDAVLKPIAKLAEGTAGWDLMIAVLGKNPITGEAVPRTPEKLIGGFMKLIHEDEIWNNIQKSNATSRAWAWFQSVLSGLMGFVSQIPDLFVSALKSLEWSDILDLPGGFMKIARIFGKFLGNFIGWAGGKVWDLLQIIFEVVAPAVMPYLKKVGAAFKGILKNPIGFVRNLVAAGKLGFENFGKNFGMHLKAGLLDWLTGSLPGVYIPKAFTLAEFGKLAISVLCISWAQIRAKIVKALGANGETIMKGLETTFDVVVALVKGGPAAAWELIKEKLTNLKDMVVDGIVSLVVDTIIKKAVPKLVSLFIPGAGFISAIVSIYDTVMVFVQKLAKIAAAVKAFVDSIVAIAAGQIGGAAAKVEGALEGLLSLAISFLAGFLGLGNIASKVLGVIEKVRAALDKALDVAINWVVTKAKALFAKLFGKKDKPDDRTDKQKEADLASALQEAQQVSKKPGITEGEVKSALVPIKQKYRMVSLTLVVDNIDETDTETIHFAGEINPTAVSGKSTLTSDKNKIITDLDLVRPSSFSSATAQALNPKNKDLIKQELDRRHVVSSEDMVTNYKTNLVGQTWAAAKKKLDPKLTLNGVDKVDPLKDKIILARTKALYKKFFNDLSNLFLGGSSENRSIGQAIDTGKPGMGEKRLAAHVAKIENQYAIGPLKVTGYD